MLCPCFRKPIGLISVQNTTVQGIAAEVHAARPSDLGFLEH